MLLALVNSAEAEWKGRRVDDQAHGMKLAVSVVRILMGPSIVDVPEMRRGVELGNEPDWLRLKWGLVIASRSLDVLEAQSMGLEGEALVSQVSCVVSFLNS